MTKSPIKTLLPHPFLPRQHEKWGGGKEEAFVRKGFRSFQIADDLIAGNLQHPAEGPELKTLYVFLNSFDKRICPREALFRLFR